MPLEIQILSLIYSFIFGIIISYFYNLFYNLINYKVKRYKILINVLFFLNIFLIYFVLLLLINNGVIHIYFILMLFLGFIFFVNKTKKLRKLIKVSVKNSKIPRK